MARSDDWQPPEDGLGTNFLGTPLEVRFRGFVSFPPNLTSFPISFRQILKRGGENVRSVMQLAQLQASASRDPHSQGMLDSRGRPLRFHGAFSGGFSAGYYNTVGSKEGWTPSQFRSSRGDRSDRQEQRAEDFMDEEDMGEEFSAGQSLRTRADFSYDHTASSQPRTILNRAPLVGNKRALEDPSDLLLPAHLLAGHPSSSSAPPESMTPANDFIADILAPRRDPIGERMLRRTGFRTHRQLAHLADSSERETGDPPLSLALRELQKPPKHDLRGIGFGLDVGQNQQGGRGLGLADRRGVAPGVEEEEEGFFGEGPSAPEINQRTFSEDGDSLDLASGRLAKMMASRLEFVESNHSGVAPHLSTPPLSVPLEWDGKHRWNPEDSSGPALAPQVEALAAEFLRERRMQRGKPAGVLLASERRAQLLGESQIRRPALQPAVISSDLHPTSSPGPASAGHEGPQQPLSSSFLSEVERERMKRAFMGAFSEGAPLAPDSSQPAGALKDSLPAESLVPGVQQAKAELAEDGTASPGITARFDTYLSGANPLAAHSSLASAHQLTQFQITAERKKFDSLISRFGLRPPPLSASQPSTSLQIPASDGCEVKTTRLVRSVQRFRPEKLLCRRLDIPDPYQRDQKVPLGTSPIPGNQASPPSGACPGGSVTGSLFDSELVTPLDQMPVREFPQVKDEREKWAEAPIPLDDDAASVRGMIESYQKRPKAPIDLFKAVFEAEQSPPSESDEENTVSSSTPAPPPSFLPKAPERSSASDPPSSRGIGDDLGIQPAAPRRSRFSSLAPPENNETGPQGSFGVGAHPDAKLRARSHAVDIALELRSQAAASQHDWIDFTKAPTKPAKTLLPGSSARLGTSSVEAPPLREDRTEPPEQNDRSGSHLLALFSEIRSRRGHRSRSRSPKRKKRSRSRSKLSKKRKSHRRGRSETSSRRKSQSKHD